MTNPLPFSFRPGHAIVGTRGQADWPPGPQPGRRWHVKPLARRPSEADDPPVRARWVRPALVPASLVPAAPPPPAEPLLAWLREFGRMEVLPR